MPGPSGASDDEDVPAGRAGYLHVASGRPTGSASMPDQPPDQHTAMRPVPPLWDQPPIPWPFQAGAVAFWLAVAALALLAIAWTSSRNLGNWPAV